jgi:nucleoside-diphosphate-sugar epimerase
MDYRTWAGIQGAISCCGSLNVDTCRRTSTQTNMPSGIILITGAPGFIGFAVLKKLVQIEDNLRVIARSNGKKPMILSALRQTGLEGSDVDSVEIRDMTASSCFKSAVRGVAYILHIASPLPVPSANVEGTIIKPAAAVTMNILHTALEMPDRTSKKW